MTDVRARGLQVRYGQQSVLDGVDLDVASGSLVSVLGPSGCGKTTLLRSIAGLLPVSGGTISIGDELVSSVERHTPPERRGIGWVPQDASLFPHLTVRENIAFGIRRSRSAAARVDELAELVGLASHLDRSPAELSGGQAQRVSLARALAPRPAVVLLDEPFAALDPMLRVALRGEVAELLRSQGSTALLVTHDQDEALSLSDRIAVMLGGRILQWGTPSDVYEQPSTSWVARFVGETVELAGDYDAGYATCVLGRLPARVLDAGVRDGSRVRVVLRPEWIELRPDGDDAIVGAVSYTGRDALITMRTREGSSVQARVGTGNLPGVGETVGLSVRGSALVYR